MIKLYLGKIRFIGERIATAGTCGRRETMTSSSHVWRVPRIWWASFVALAACLGTGSGSLRSQERVAADPGSIQIFEPNRGPLPDGSKACDVAYAKVRYLIDELITERFENARLSIELAEAKVEGAEIEKASRQQEAVLGALTAVVATRDRRDAAVRSEIADLRQGLEAAQAELQRKGAENDRLAAELAAAYKAADAATVMARDNLAVINAQIEALHAAAGNAAGARTERPAELLSAVWVDVAPAIPRQKPLLEAAR
jgi:hypothetical protein